MEKLLTLYTNHMLYTIDDEKYVLDVFNQLKRIRVLVLDSWNITNIPDCISELRHLRYLDVSLTSVESLPDSLCHLYNLQTLETSRDELALPKDIVNISSLRYVRASLSTCKGVGKLTSLQELSSIHVCEGDNIRELGDMQKLRGKFTIGGLGNVEKLEDDVGALMDKQTLMDELGLEFDKQLEKSTISEEVLDALGCPPNLTHLSIARYTGVKPPSWMVDGKHKFDKLQTLKLLVCPKLESLPPLREFANFMTSLSRLDIYHCDGLKRLQLDALVSLKELEITRCSSLVQITSPIYEKLRISSCKLLEKMDVARCESLRSLSIDIHGLDSLEYLRIHGCPTLELAFEDGSVVVRLRTISTDNTQVFRTLLHHEYFDSLEYLCIANLGGFENFDKLRSLRVLEINRCPQLQSLPPDFHKLSSLEELEINKCPQLQSLPPDFHKFSSLESLSIEECPQLQSLPPDFHKLSSLKNLYISDCPQLQSLPPDFHKLSSLKRLRIFDCSQLQSLPVDGLPPSLTYLEICCPLLYERCKDEFGLDWHKINHIPKRRIR